MITLCADDLDGRVVDCSCQYSDATSGCVAWRVPYGSTASRWLDVGGRHGPIQPEQLSRLHHLAAPATRVSKFAGAGPTCALLVACCGATGPSGDGPPHLCCCFLFLSFCTTCCTPPLSSSNGGASPTPSIENKLSIRTASTGVSDDNGTIIMATVCEREWSCPVGHSCTANQKVLTTAHL
jgi:hypothetical protein